VPKYLTIFIALLPFLAFGADSVGTNHLYIAATGQYNINKWNVYNSIEQPNLIKAKNTFGQSVSLGYSRVTKYGLIIMVGAGLCTRDHDIYIVKSIQDYDPASLTDDNVGTKLKFKMKSIDPEVMIGYRKAINNDYALIFKTGLIQKRFLTAERRGEAVISIYPTSNNTYTSKIMYIYEVLMGKPSQTFGVVDEIVYNSLIPQFSMGVECKYNYRYIKYFSIDLDMILMKPLIRAHIQEVEVVSGNNVNTSSVSLSNYIDRFASIGLKVSLGLWK